MNDRLMIAAMAMQGMLASPDCIGDAQAVSGDAIECADALLAAAGEKEDDTVSRTFHNSLMRDFVARAEAAESKLAACERERDALGTKVADLEVNGERRESINQGLKHEIGMLALEIAALKRRLEPLTLQEGGGVNNPIIYGSRPLAWDEITAIVADADRIRSRRQP